MEVIYYITAAGNQTYKAFLKELQKKKLVNEIYCANELVEDLLAHGMELLKSKELKPLLLPKYDIYELKRKGASVRIGVYICRSIDGKRFVILGGFLKDSAKTRKSDIETLKKRVIDYRKRNK